MVESVDIKLEIVAADGWGKPSKQRKFENIRDYFFNFVQKYFKT